MNKRGITLVILVVTIVLLLILAGVTITISIGNGNVVDKTAQAANTWNGSQTAEEQTINELWKKGKAKGLTIPSELAIGDSVTWTPNGKYTEWKAVYYADKDDGNYDKVLYSGNTAENEGVTTTTSWNTKADGNNNVDLTISNWKVLNIDKGNEKVTLVPENPTTAGVNLAGAQGYNNGVKLLNDACSALYGNENGVTARSINIEDIDGTSGLISVDVTNINEAKASSAKIAYGTQYTGGYETSNPYSLLRSYGLDGNNAGAYVLHNRYPILYEEEALREINNVYSSTGLGMSTAKSSFISRANNAETFITNTVIRPKQTYYELYYKDFAPVLGTYASLIVPNGINTRDYWVASRCIDMYDGSCIFRVSGIFTGRLCGGAAFYSNSNGWGTFKLGLFPIVTLSSGTLTGSNHSYTYTPVS